MTGPNKKPRGGGPEAQDNGTDKLNQTQADYSTPTACFVGPGGVTVSVLKPFWQQRPRLSPTVPGINLQLACWRDGITCPVPPDAPAQTLRAFYCGARIIAEMMSLEVAP